MNDLHRRGVDGVRVVMYGNSMDSPGRRELLNMQAVTAFYPCPHCLYNPQPGLRKQVFGGFRCFLPLGSPWRQREFVYKGHRYMFRDVEQRQPPLARTDRNVALMVSLARPRRPWCGHKGPPFLSKWVGFDWKGNFCDVMHDIKLFVGMTVCCLVGKGSEGIYKSWGTAKKDSKHLDDCKVFDIFHEFHDGTTRFSHTR